MSSVIPSPTGSIERASANILNTIIEGARMAQERNIASQQIQEQKVRDALSRVAQFAPLVKPGTTVADNPFLASSMRTLFPQAGDPTNPSSHIGSLVINPETIQNVLMPQIVQHVQSLPPEEQASWLDRFTNTATLGRPGQTTGQLNVGASQAQVQLNAIHALQQDPVTLSDIGRRLFGLQQPVRMVINGKQVAWSTDTAANLAVGLAKFGQELSFQQEQLSRQNVIDLSGELMKQVQKAGAEISRPVANEIITNTAPRKGETQQQYTKRVQAWIDKMPQNSAIRYATDLYLHGKAIAGAAQESFLPDDIKIMLALHKAFTDNGFTKPDADHAVEQFLQQVGPSLGLPGYSSGFLGLGAGYNFKGLGSSQQQNQQGTTPSSTPYAVPTGSANFGHDAIVKGIEVFFHDHGYSQATVNYLKAKGYGQGYIDEAAQKGKFSASTSTGSGQSVTPTGTTSTPQDTSGQSPDTTTTTQAPQQPQNDVSQILHTADPATLRQLATAGDPALRQAATGLIRGKNDLASVNEALQNVMVAEETARESLRKLESKPKKTAADQAQIKQLQHQIDVGVKVRTIIGGAYAPPQGVQ